MSVGVCLNDLRLGDRQHPRRRLKCRDRDRPVNQLDPSPAQLAGVLRDLARHPPLDLEPQHGRPQQRHPELQVEHRGDIVLGRDHPGSAGDRELGDAQLGDLRRTVTAELHQSVATTARRYGARLRLRVAGVQVAPTQRQPHVLHVSRAARTRASLDRGQGGGRVEVGEVAARHVLILVELMFEIE